MEQGNKMSDTDMNPDMNSDSENGNDRVSDHENDSVDSEPENTIVIQTHDKRFHTDEVGAISLLNSYYAQKKKQVHLIRSRNPELLEKADVLVDVGGIYDPNTLRFDHHQKGCEEYFADGFTVKMSSIGMVWKHFGKDLLSMYIQSHSEFSEVDCSDYIDGLHTEVYFKSIQEIDGHDNGIAPTLGGKFNYGTYMTIGNIISSFNTPDTNNEEEQMKAFQHATNMFGTVFEKRLEDIIRKYLDYQLSRSIISDQIDNMSKGTEYLIITDKIATSTVFKCLNELDSEGNIKFIVFNPDDEDEVTIRTRGKKENFRVPMIPLLSKDRLVDDYSLNEDDIVFVHNNRFIAKTKTIEAAIMVVGASVQGQPVPQITLPQSYLKIPTIGNRSDWIVWGSLGLAGTAVVGTMFMKNSSNN